ncbi:hypothetical protein HAX54_032790, partial [Datura stramonium]|nr:hypothetical protein [Datura stramonium]
GCAAGWEKRGREESRGRSCGVVAVCWWFVMGSHRRQGWKREYNGEGPRWQRDEWWFAWCEGESGEKVRRQVVKGGDEDFFSVGGCRREEKKRRWMQHCSEGEKE